MEGMKSDLCSSGTCHTVCLVLEKRERVSERERESGCLMCKPMCGQSTVDKLKAVSGDSIETDASQDEVSAVF